MVLIYHRVSDFALRCFPKHALRTIRQVAGFFMVSGSGAPWLENKIRMNLDHLGD
jgi:hypothetical protein